MRRSALIICVFLCVASGCQDAKAPPPSVNKARGPLTSEAAQNLYVRACSSCHGLGGKGDGPRGRRIGKLPDFTDPTFHSARGDEQLLGTIANGVGRMPGFKHRFGDHELKALVGVVRGKKE